MHGIATTFLLGFALAHGLILELGHDDYARRERASKALESLGALAVPQLEIAQHDKDREVAQRAGRILSKHYRATAEWQAERTVCTSYPFLPWIDHLPGACWGQNLGYPTGAGDRDDGHWTSWRKATKLWIRDQLSAGVSPAEIVKQLDEAAERELGWWRLQEREPEE